MAKDKNYTALMNCARWRTLRNAYLTEHPLCERCQQQGRTIAANCVHHIAPVEEAKDLQAMTERAYNWANLQALCLTCHSEIHRAERSHSRSAVKQRQADRLERWKQAHTQQHNAAAVQPPGGTFLSEGV